ncbi:hypothetical protein ACEQPO_22220 [Bacillus sp. SL00103]
MAKQKTYESKQTVQNDTNKKPKPAIQSPIYGYHHQNEQKQKKNYLLFK